MKDAVCDDIRHEMQLPTPLAERMFGQPSVARHDEAAESEV